MSLSLPSQRLLRKSLKSPTLTYTPLPHSRHFWRKSKPVPALDPLSTDFLKKKPNTPSPNALPKAGDLADSSIFESPDGTPRPQPTTPNQPSQGPHRRDPSSMAAALDPQPLTRARWERKMLIRSIRQRGRLSKTDKILRTERSSLSKSHMFKTSVKKLGPLARQIAGKPIEDAIVQMRFSRKKVAQEVRRHLEAARNEAVVVRGMGLGGQEEKEGEDGESGEAPGVLIEDKKGKKRLVKDKSAIYVDQAWVGRGKYGEAPSYRARGRLNILKLPFTSISVILKEEATRVRLFAEREQKRANKKPWIPLPNRPVTAQRQYCLW